jgi:Skp family chaperone for outer membrane proteins
MKFNRPLFLSLLAAALIAPLAAQTAAGAPAAKPAVAQLAPVSVAYVNTGAFLEPATGIKQLVRVAQSLDLEFSSQQQDLSLLGEKLRTLVTELNKLNSDPVANAAAIAGKQVEGQKMQQEMQGKQQAAQQAYNARAQELQGPVLADISKALTAFANERNIGMLFDMAKLAEAVLVAKPELDLTADFIGYYNALHP